MCVFFLHHFIPLCRNDIGPLLESVTRAQLKEKDEKVDTKKNNRISAKDHLCYFNERLQTEKEVFLLIVCSVVWLSCLSCGAVALFFLSVLLCIFLLASDNN